MEKPGHQEASALPQILLVEDSPTTAALLSRYLSGHYRLLHARDGEEAWRLLVNNAEIELVINPFLLYLIADIDNDG